MTFADRVKETTTTTGTGTYNLIGAETGFQSFITAGQAGLTVKYMVTDDIDWEVGEGTITDSAPDTLSRDTIEDSSNGGAAVNWGAGTKTVGNVFPASSANAGGGGGGGQTVLLFSDAAVSTISLNVDWANPELYSEINIIYRGNFTTDNIDLRGRVRQGGSEVASANYSRTMQFSGDTNITDTSQSSTLFLFTGGGSGGIGNASGEGFAVDIKIIDPGNTTRFKHIFSRISYDRTNGSIEFGTGSGRLLLNTDAIDGVNFAGSFLTETLEGEVRAYGLLK